MAVVIQGQSFLYGCAHGGETRWLLKGPRWRGLACQGPPPSCFSLKGSLLSMRMSKSLSICLTSVLPSCKSLTNSWRALKLGLDLI